jgi:hypothetical protein
MKLHSLGFTVAVFSATVLAQAPAAEKAPLAKHSCPKPNMPDATKALTTDERNAVIRSLETFRSCVQAFSDSQKQLAATKQKEAENLKLSALDASQAATSAAAAADAAAKDYNSFSEQAVKIITPKEPAAATKKAGSAEPPAQRPQKSY